MAIVGDDEAVNVEFETVLDRGVVDFGDDFARPLRQTHRSPIETSSCGVLYGNPKLVLEWREPAPSAPITLVVMPRNATPYPSRHLTLEPERVREAAQELVTTVMTDGRLTEYGPQLSGTIAPPSMWLTR